MQSGIAALADQSLLHRIEAEGGEVRFAMLDTVREFARDRLEEAGDEETCSPAARGVVPGSRCSSASLAGNQRLAALVGPT